MIVELPWFPKELSPNFRSRSHWPKTRAVKRARQDAAWLAATAIRAAGLKGSHPASFTVQTTFHPPTAHVRDGDNLQASCKAFYDGIADAIGCNDSLFRHQEPIIGGPVKGGRIVVEIGT